MALSIWRSDCAPPNIVVFSTGFIPSFPTLLLKRKTFFGKSFLKKISCQNFFIVWGLSKKKIDEAHLPQFRAPYHLPCRRRRTDYNTLHSSLNTSNSREKDQTAIFELAQRVGREYNNHNLHIRLQGLQQPHSPCFHSAILTQNALNFLVKGKGP